MRPQRIISGGQTGADQAGLAAALFLGIPTGGWAPNGWRTEDGRAEWLASLGLRQHVSADYSPRTRANVEEADLTLIFGDTASSGSQFTANVCRGAGKHYLLNPSARIIRDCCDNIKPRVINVAGNRASKNPEIFQRVYDTLVEAFTVVQEPAPSEPTAPLLPADEDDRPAKAQRSEAADLLDEIQILLDSGDYDWASSTLEGIYESVENSGRVTEGQRRAVHNIGGSRQANRHTGRMSRRYR